MVRTDACEDARVTPRYASVVAPSSSSSQPAPQPSAFRQRVSELSYPALRWLSMRPRWLLAVTTTVLLVAGLLAPLPYGPVCLGLVTALLVWLAYLSWPSGTPAHRLVRLVMVGLAIGAFALRLLS